MPDATPASLPPRTRRTDELLAKLAEQLGFGGGGGADPNKHQEGEGGGGPSSIPHEWRRWSWVPPSRPSRSRAADQRADDAAWRSIDVPSLGKWIDSCRSSQRTR